MTRLPREPLDADERALAARLPRLHGCDEPDPALDARILAAAHAGLSPAPLARRRRGWIVPLTAAASVSLAVGLAWQLQPPPGPPVVAHAPVATAIEVGDGGQAAVQADQTVPLPPPPSPMVLSKPLQAPPTQATPASDAVRESAAEPSSQPRADARAVAPVFAPPPPPPPPPAPAAPVVANGAPMPVPAPQAAMARSASTDADAGASGALMQSQAKRVRANEADLAAEALTSEQFAKPADTGDDDVPPATMDAPAARDAWLRRIGELQQQGRIDEAKASLAEFRRRYPDALLPPELRKLEP